MEINSTLDGLRQFKESVIWSDFVRELEMWKTGFEQERASIVDNAADSNPSTASVLLHLGDVNGRVKAVDYMLSLPDIFIQLLEDKIEEEQDRSKNEQTNREEEEPWA